MTHSNNWKSTIYALLQQENISAYWVHGKIDASGLVARNTWKCTIVCRRYRRYGGEGVTSRRNWIDRKAWSCSVLHNSSPYTSTSICLVSLFLFLSLLFSSSSLLSSHPRTLLYFFRAVWGAYDLTANYQPSTKKAILKTPQGLLSISI